MLTEKTCNNCKYFVEEKDLGNWSHEEAVKCGHGFCLMEDLFTDTNPSDPACINYKEYEKE